MKRLTLATWMLLAAGFFPGGQPLVAGDNKGVIFDPTWTIVIRPANRNPQVAPAASTSAVSPAAYEEEQPPVPESVATPQPEAHGARPIGPELPPQMQPQPLAQIPTGPPRMSYAEAYAAVPFSRAEYEGNPVYRHQAALELMFGVQRPMTLVQNYTPRASRYPDSYQIPYGRSDTQHINIRQIGRNNGNYGLNYPFSGTSNW